MMLFEKRVHARLYRSHRTELAASDINSTSYYRNGNYTVCLAETFRGTFRMGIAKCNPNCDRFDVNRGMEIAFARALAPGQTATPGPKSSYTTQEDL